MLSKNLNIVLKNVNSTCDKIGRDSKEIKILAISKTKPVSMINEFFNLGLRSFGENKAQDFRDKVELIKLDIDWHFVGHLQKNKVKYVVGKASLIHSIDNLEIAQAIEKKASELGIKQKILMEVNTSGEKSKFGIQSETEIFKFADYCKKSDSLKLAGLMTMAPFTEDEETIRNSFRKLREIKDKLNDNGFSLTELSMGMSNDYQIAIEEGATIIRLGTILFGERDLNKNWREE